MANILTLKSIGNIWETNDYEEYSHLCLGLPNSFFPSYFPTRVLGSYSITLAFED
jgi:hypothetical protein